MDKVLLAVYGIEITQNRNKQLVNSFGGNVDFLNLFHDFADHVLRNVKTWPRNKKVTLALTCASPPTLLEDEREVYGHFDAGRDGDRFKVKNLAVKGSSDVHVTPDLHATRDAFFYLYVPKSRKRAYLILQRAEGQGIKDLVLHFLRVFMNERGLQQYQIEHYNLVNNKVFDSMMDKGFFKEFVFVKNGVPKDLDDLNNNDVKVPLVKGTVKTIYQATDLPDYWKALGRNLIRRKPQDTKGDSRIVVDILGTQDEYDEVSMRIDLNGKVKTFHVANSSRIQPDLDVTSNVGFDRFGQPLLKDLLEQARDLVSDVTDKVSDDDIKN